LLQALWREDRDLPIGSYVGEDGKRRKLGSRISEAAAQGGGRLAILPAIQRGYSFGSASSSFKAADVISPGL
jgi:hypothetical protein